MSFKFLNKINWFEALQKKNTFITRIRSSVFHHLKSRASNQLFGFCLFLFKEIIKKTTISLTLIAELILKQAHCQFR